MRRWFIVFCLLIAWLAPAAPAQAGTPAPITVENNKATLEFPNEITFSVSLASASTILTATLEYGVDQLTCSAVFAEAFPQFTPSRGVTAAWTWDMQQGGSLPPGAKVYWQWRAIDADGHQLLTDRQTVTWFDNQYNWRTVSHPQVNLHYYTGDQAFAQRLHAAALTALDTISKTTGLQPGGPFDLYIYASTQDMQDVVFYEPSWVGGQAYPEFNIALIGINPSNEAWGKHAEVHELAHLVVGRYAFGCLATLPTWLDEGLAVYAAGGPEPNQQQSFNIALRQDNLLAVRWLDGVFSRNSAVADLSYAESYSLVNFLYTAYKPEKMRSLLKALREGNTIDDALSAVYGFRESGLEKAWRQKIGAKPQAAPGDYIVKTPARPVPTIWPVAGLTLEPTATPLPPTPTPAPPTEIPPTATLAPTLPAPPSPPPPATPPTATFLGLALAGCIGLCVIILLVAVGLVFVLRARRHS